jgi:hypothetical protein
MVNGGKSFTADAYLLCAIAKLIRVNELKRKEPKSNRNTSWDMGSEYCS